MSANRIAQSLTWLGGGEWRELGERHERSTHVIAGVVVLLAAALSWLVSALAVTESTHASAAVAVPLTLVFGLLVGAVSRAIAGGPDSQPVGHRRTCRHRDRRWCGGR